MRRILAITALITGVYATRPVYANGEIGAPIVIDVTSDVSVTFASSDAGATGSLYFLGAEKAGVMQRSTSTDANDLGMFLFSNHGAIARSTFDLGVIAGGSVLHFAYLITNGVGVAPTGSLFRTDTTADQGYFSVETIPSESGPTLFNVGVEDIRNPSQADWDFNDMTFEVNAFAVPAPGAGMLMATAGLLAAPRRKRG